MSRCRFVLVCSIVVLAGCGERQLTAPERRVPHNPSAVQFEAGTVVQISAGAGYTCVLKTDGAVACWGFNDAGQASPPAITFTQVSAGGGNTCALDASGTAVCWGRTFGGVSSPPTFRRGPFTQVSAGYSHACALEPDGGVSCWGWNDYGQATPPAGTFTQVSSSLTYTCAIRTDGTVSCWGRNDYGQATPPAGTFTQVTAGYSHACALATDGTVVCWGRNDDGQAKAPGGTFAEVSAGASHTCALSTEGAIACWGNDDYGQVTRPTGTFTQVSAGESQSCALAVDGAVVCWGGNTGGAPPGYEGAMPPGGTFMQVSAGWRYACALRTDGRLACWGDNNTGRAIPPAGTFKQLSSGKEHSCAIRTDGTVACWGFNYNGEATPPPGTFTQVSAGAYHTCALKTDGTLACWGQNVVGEATPPPGTFTQVSAGGAQSCALRPDGSLVCWGGYVSGHAPLAGPFTQVDAGGVSACALKTNGDVICWTGRDYATASSETGPFTQVSVGARHVCTLKPNGAAVCGGLQMPPEHRFTQVSAGDGLTCALEPDQSLACWGDFAIAEVDRWSAPAQALPGGPYVGSEGTPIALALGGSDPDEDPLFFYWNLGDGTTGGGELLPPASHVYADDGVYSIRLRVTDGFFGGGGNEKTTTATIANVAPSIPEPGGLIGPAAPIQLAGGTANAPIQLVFADPAGTHDTYTARIQCGNGTTVSDAGVVSPYSAICSYTAAGVYTVSATVSDEDGGTSPVALFQSVVVYEPSGALATGSGRFTSPPSACPTLCGSATNTASFTFNARFLSGRATTPDGSATFLLQGERSTRWRRGPVLELHSTSLEMLIVSSGRAQLWGTGTVNDAPGYTFRITAVDAGPGGAADAFRIEIRDPSKALVYDNQWGAARNAAVTTPIEGGQISIHEPWGRGDR